MNSKQGASSYFSTNLSPASVIYYNKEAVSNLIEQRTGVDEQGLPNAWKYVEDGKIYLEDPVQGTKTLLGYTDTTPKITPSIGQYADYLSISAIPVYEPTVIRDKNCCPTCKQRFPSNKQKEEVVSLEPSTRKLLL